MSQIEVLNYISKQIYIYGYGLSIIGGLFGNTINIITFSTKLKDNVCSYYLIVGDIFNNICLMIYLLPSVIQLAYGTNGTEFWLPWCRLMYYIGDTSLLISTYTICLTAIDRYLFTSRYANRRRLSSKRNAKISLCTIICICLILTSPDLIHWHIDEESKHCTATTIYHQYMSYFLTPVVSSFIPLIILSTTGYKTYRNMRTSIHPTVTTNGMEHQRRRMDHQVSQMVLIQSLIFLIQTISFCIVSLYETITSHLVKSNMRIAIEHLCIAIGYIIYSTFLWTSFYVYYVQSPSFRANVNKTLKIRMIFM